MCLRTMRAQTLPFYNNTIPTFRVIAYSSSCLNCPRMSTPPLLSCTLSLISGIDSYCLALPAHAPFPRGCPGSSPVGPTPVRKSDWLPAGQGSLFARQQKPPHCHSFKSCIDAGKNGISFFPPLLQPALQPLPCQQQQHKAVTSIQQKEENFSESTQTTYFIVCSDKLS